MMYITTAPSVADLVSCPMLLEHYVVPASSIHFHEGISTSCGTIVLAAAMLRVMSTYNVKLPPDLSQYLISMLA